MLDCGPGVLAKLREREAWPQVDAIAITHWHLDHWGDLVPWVWGSTLGPGEGVEQPELWVPPEGRELLCSIGGRLGQPEMFEEAFRLNEYADGEPFTAAGFEVTAHRVLALPAARVRLPRLGERDGRRLLRRLGPERRARRDRPRRRPVRLRGDAAARRTPRAARAGTWPPTRRSPRSRQPDAKRLLLTHRPFERPLEEDFELARDGLEIEL